MGSWLLCADPAWRWEGDGREPRPRETPKASAELLKTPREAQPPGEAAGWQGRLEWCFPVSLRVVDELEREGCQKAALFLTVACSKHTMLLILAIKLGGGSQLSWAMTEN